MDFKPKEKAQNTAFSALPAVLEKLDAIAGKYDTTRSGVIQYLIEKEHLRLTDKGSI